MIKRYLIIGASAAGIGCALRLRMLDATAQITMLSAEADLPYNKCLLADVLLGEKTSNDILLCSEEMLVEKRITLLLSMRVIALEPDACQVVCADGRRFIYDALCIATGRSPRMLPLLEGKNAANVFNFYTQHDLDIIIHYIQTAHARSALIIGAGLTGLEAADGLRARGLQVTIIEAAAHVLPTLINARAAGVIMEHARAKDITVCTQERVVAYESVEDRITMLSTASGNRYPTDLVVCAIGATPNTAFLPPLLLDEHGYCHVDAQMQTNIPGIYAAGDCCIVYDRLQQRLQPNALWSDAMQQGLYAAYGMCGITKLYGGSVAIASSAFFGIKIAIAGPVIPKEGERVEETLLRSSSYEGQAPLRSSSYEGQAPLRSSSFRLRQDYAGQVEGQAAIAGYHQFIYDSENKLRAFMLIGNTSELAHYRRMLLSA